MLVWKWCAVCSVTALRGSGCLDVLGFLLWQSGLSLSQAEKKNEQDERNNLAISLFWLCCLYSRSVMESRFLKGWCTAVSNCPVKNNQFAVESISNVFSTPPPSRLRLCYVKDIILLISWIKTNHSHNKPLKQTNIFNKLFFYLLFKQIWADLAFHKMHTLKVQ